MDVRVFIAPAISMFVALSVIVGTTSWVCFTDAYAHRMGRCIAAEQVQPRVDTTTLKFLIHCDDRLAKPNSHFTYVMGTK